MVLLYFIRNFDVVVQEASHVCLRCHLDQKSLHWLIIVCALTEDQTLNRGAWGRRCDSLNYPARAEKRYFNEVTLTLENSKFKIYFISQPSLI